jgi:hypothetical protein
MCLQQRARHRMRLVLCALSCPIFIVGRIRTARVAHSGK